MLLAVVALGVLLTANEGLVLAEEALVVTEAAIMRSPQFIVGVCGSWIVCTLALGLMHLSKVDIG